MAVPCELLLYPELLSNAQLITIIHERHLRIENIEKMTRFELIELFRNYCVPYGQRKYRDTGRGKVLNKSRHYSPEPAPKLNLTMTYNNQSRKMHHSKCDRLKPPPDPLSGQMKKIKLETSISTNTEINDLKRKMSIDTPTFGMDTSPPKKERKLITWP